MPAATLRSRWIRRAVYQVFDFANPHAHKRQSLGESGTSTGLCGTKSRANTSRQVSHQASERSAMDTTTTTRWSAPPEPLAPDLRTRHETEVVLQYVPSTRMISVRGRQENRQPADWTIAGTSPLRAVLEITSRCNLACAYCSQRFDDKRRSLTLQEAIDVIDQLEELRVFELSIRGGEATIHPDFSSIWAAASAKPFLSVNVITNGMVFDVNRVSTLLANPRSKIIVSLDGPDSINSRFRSPRQYARVMQWLPEVLATHRTQVVVLSTLYQHSLPLMPIFARDLAEIGLIQHHVTLLKRIGGGDSPIEGFVGIDDVRRLEEQLLSLTHDYPAFAPLVICPRPHRLRDMLTDVPIPLFTEFHCGTGMRITADGTIGISQIVLFGQSDAPNIGASPSTFPRTLGNIRQRSLKDAWSNDTLPLRQAQAAAAKQRWPYYVGWDPASEA
jgi:MoaA/NifB/PqqE/SkfB family radical SAM enzyme